MAVWLFAALSLGVAAFHLAVILGAPWGRLTMGGRWPGVLPWYGRVLSALSATLVLGMAVVLRDGPGWAVWGVAAVMALGVAGNAATPSPAERLIWLPVTIAMLLAAVSVAV